MKIIILVLVVAGLFGCTHTGEQVNREELVSVKTSMQLAEQAYVLGCITAFNSVSIKGKMLECRDKAKIYRNEDLKIILEGPVTND